MSSASEVVAVFSPWRQQRVKHMHRSTHVQTLIVSLHYRVKYLALFILTFAMIGQCSVFVPSCTISGCLKSAH